MKKMLHQIKMIFIALSLVFISVQSKRTVFAALTSEEMKKDTLTLLSEKFADNAQVSSVDLTTLKEVLFLNFETKADDIAMQNVVQKKLQLESGDFLKYVVPLLNAFRIEHQIPFQNDQMTQQQRAMFEAYLPIARQKALENLNAEITNKDEFEVIAAETKQTLELFINEGLFNQQGLTIATLKQDLPALYRGLFFLQQQYSFENGLALQLVKQPHTIKGIADSGLTMYDRLKTYGGTTYRAERGGFLNQNRQLFTERQISNFTGFSSIEAMIEKLAQRQQLTSEAYYKKQTEAILGETENVSVYETIKNQKTNLYLPILSQGKGVYVAASKNAVTIGMTDTYLDQYDTAALTKNRGENQPTTPFFMPMIQSFNHYMQFLESVKKKEIPFVTAQDSHNHRYHTHPQKIGTWSKPEGNDAAEAVRRFFTPTKMYIPYTKRGVGLGGVSTSASSLIAYETRLMNKNMSGVGLFTHEMTHGNDEAAMYGGEYQVHGRRNGQGPEIFARGMFEAIDNTQGESAYSPVFNINTAIPIAASEKRTQSVHPLNSKEKVEKYIRNLIDLISYLEVKEAEVALQMNEADKVLYFNKVLQVTPKKLGSVAGRTQVVEDSQRVQSGSTNDAFVPFGTLGSTIPQINTIEDLVRNDAVSAQFIPNARSPFITNLQTNQYDSVPLLESYYAASIAENGKNTVGDISFKRHAYEVLGWKGWEAFVTYVSDQHTSDQAAYRAILNGETVEDWESYKINQYQKLSKMQPVNALWNEEDLKAKLQVAIQQDLAFIKALKNQSSAIFNQWNETVENRNQLSNVAINMNFDRNAVNVRNVKMEILKTALAYNELMASVLENPMQTASVNYRFVFENGNETQFDTTKVNLPNTQNIIVGTEITLPEYAIVESKNHKGEFKFKGWTPTTSTITNDVTYVGTWQYRDDVVIPVTTNYVADETLQKGMRVNISSGVVGYQSAFNNVVKTPMQPAIIKVGTKPTEEIFETNLTEQVVPDRALHDGEEKVVLGRPQIEKQITTYELNPTDGTLRSVVGERKITQEGIPTIKYVGRHIVVNFEFEVIGNTKQQLQVEKPQPKVIDKDEEVALPTFKTQVSKDGKGEFVFSGYTKNSAANGDITYIATWKYIAYPTPKTIYHNQNSVTNVLGQVYLHVDPMQKNHPLLENKDVALYDIYFTNAEGEKVTLQPREYTVALQKNRNEKVINVYYLDEVNHQLMNHQFEDMQDKVIFKTNHFSIYVLEYEKTKQSSVVEKNKQTETPKILKNKDVVKVEKNYPSAKPIVETADQTQNVLWMFIVSVLCIVFLKNKKA